MAIWFWVWTWVSQLVNRSEWKPRTYSSPYSLQHNSGFNFLEQYGKGLRIPSRHLVGTMIHHGKGLRIPSRHLVGTMILNHIENFPRAAGL